MQEGVLLIDFENIQQIDISKLWSKLRVVIFVGSSQKSIPFDLVQSAQKMSDRVEWVKIEGSGTNALDFHIAYFLGSYINQFPNALYFVLSKDSGYDPLLCYLKKKNYHCYRIRDIEEIKVISLQVANEKYELVLEVLRRMEKNKPKKMESLLRSLSLRMKTKISEDETAGIVERLIKEEKISETDGKLSYNL
jgi:hypothetical protein